MLTPASLLQQRHCKQGCHAAYSLRVTPPLSERVADCPAPAGEVLVVRSVCPTTAWVTFGILFIDLGELVGSVAAELMPSGPIPRGGPETIR